MKEDMSKHKGIAITLCLLACCYGSRPAAQEIWDVDRCMEYAVKHNRTVRQRPLEADN